MSRSALTPQPRGHGTGGLPQPSTGRHLSDLPRLPATPGSPADRLSGLGGRLSRAFASHVGGRAVSALVVSGVTFWCYRATLLPGLDLGDTASFQATVGSLTLTPRNAYPLYYAIGSLFVWLSQQEPAYALNLASAVCGALASGATTWVAATLVESTAAGLFSGLLFGLSYTFWSQSVIAEVYALHLLATSASLAALLAWFARPTRARLVTFFAIYALGFGNHLSMILLLPGFTLFLLFGSADGPRRVLQPQVILLAVSIAAIGSLQYVWNLQGLWRTDLPPTSLADALGRFWFDVTKADWRESFILGVSSTRLPNRLSMYWFDLQQQFGRLGVGAAALGAAYLMWTRPWRGLLTATVYAANMLFALTYNVGDTHVFFLPAHLAVALFAAGAVGWLRSIAARKTSRRLTPALVGGLCLLYPLWRGLDTFPAADRSDDRRATAFLDAITRDVTDQNAVFNLDMNWQIENAVDYYAKYQRPDLAWFHTGEVVPHFPAFVQDNAEIGRQVLLTPLAWQRIAAIYRGRFEATLDPRVAVPTLDQTVARFPPGTPYALAVLAPYREFVVDEPDLMAASLRLTGGRTRLVPGRNYQMVVGTAGDRPAVLEARDRPFRLAAQIGDLRVDIRMESWLPVDTMRRGGFGHVIINRRHALTLERGISFAVFERTGRVRFATYAAGLLAPQPRYILRPGP